MNQQKIEKRSKRTDDLLAVHSIFHTIQGEGPFCGTPAVFIRLAGCNLQCPQCDTDYSSKRQSASALQILASVAMWARRGLVVITGGEPFRQNLTELLTVLTNCGYYVQIETNGTFAPSTFDYNFSTDKRRGAYIVCSPKTGRVNHIIEQYACAMKYVMSASSVDDQDGLPIQALDHPVERRVARPTKNFTGLVYLQPLDVKDPIQNQLNLEAVVKSCMTYGHILQLQVHKLIGMQ